MKKHVTKRKSVGMIRVSTHLQSDNTSLTFQEEKIQQYSELHDLDLVKVVSDVCSGSLETREGVDEVKSMVQKGEVDCVVIWNTSRSFRSVLHFSRFVSFLKEHKVELVSVSEGLSSFSKHGQMVFQIMSSISEYEREIIKERMISGKRSKVKNGERKIGGSIFGYTMKNGTLETDDNSEVVSFIFKKMNGLMKQNITKTKRTQKLLKSLRRKGFTFKGRNFTHQNVKSILSNSFYCGTLKYDDITTNHIHDTIVSKRLYNNVQYV